MKLDQEHKALIFTIAGFAVYLLLREYFAPIKEQLDKITQNGLANYILTYAILGTPIYIGAYIINPKLSIIRNLGLYHNPIKPFMIALLFSMPMFLGGFAFFKLNGDFSVPNLIAGSIVIGIVEELFFRGFLFGQLFKYTRLGFISSIVLGAIVFASGHLYQSHDTVELIGIFSVTFMGAVLFAWLFVEWNYNLWIPIFLHALMNLSWHVFEMDPTALGGVLPNVFRGLTISLAIVFTIMYKRRRKLDLIITKNKLLRKTI